MDINDVEKIIIHCSATRENDNSVDFYTIDKWHKARGWKGCGYHFVVLIDGTIQIGRGLNEIGAHTVGFNKNSWGICYVGGLERDGKTPKDTRTNEQKESLKYLIGFLKRLKKDVTVHGHRDFSPKACPSFDATSEYINL